MIGFEFERAFKMLISYFPEETIKKPTLFHSLRVGVFLWNNGYSEELQIAGLLHDSLEDTDLPEYLIMSNFGQNVLDIVKSNSKNINLEKSEILEDIVKRCSIVGENAMIIKVADIYDNFLFYKKINNLSEIERCKKIAELLKKYKKTYWNDDIFKKLDEILIG